jgi:hypothetical protein
MENLKESINESKRMKELAGLLNENTQTVPATNVEALKGVKFRMYPSRDGKMDPSVYTNVTINDASPLEAGASNMFLTKLKVTADPSAATQTQDNQELIEANNYMAKNMSNFIIMVRDSMGSGKFTEVMTDYPNPNSFGVEKNSDIIVAINKAFGNVFKFAPKKGYESEFSSLYAKN